MQRPLEILVVDDEKVQRETLAAILSDHGYATRVAEDVSSAVAALRSAHSDVVLSDFRIPGGSGLDVARRAGELCPDAVSLIMTAYADVESVIEAMRLGVADYLLKPLNVESLLKRLQILTERRHQQLEVGQLRTSINRALAFGRTADSESLLGESSKIIAARELIGQVALARGTVLITGESGTGKEVAARQIHARSAQAEQRFVAINCGALPETLLESELFGHKKGAFTGAVADKPGLLAVANEGTLFLDEIGDMPKSLQVKLLRVLQEREFVPVGETKPTKVNLRVIAATNADLTSAVASGAFRQDLYYRINVVELRMPALRERADDIPLLARHFLEKYARELAQPVRALSGEACRALMRYPWPGNVRELENVIERALILSGGSETIGVKDLPPTLVVSEIGLADSVRARDGTVDGGTVDGGTVDSGAVDSGTVKLEDAVREFSRTHIVGVLKATGGDKKEAAKALGISLSSLYRKLEELGIRKADGDGTA